jgi:hypothetical protein
LILGTLQKVQLATARCNAKQAARRDAHHTGSAESTRPAPAAAGLLDASSSRIATRIHLEHTTITVDSQNEWSVLREVSTLKAPAALGAV